MATLQGGGRPASPGMGPGGGNLSSVVRHLDLATVGSVCGLVVLGLLAVFTATVDPEHGRLLQAPSALFNRQLVFCLVGGATLLAVILFDYRHFRTYAGVMFVVTLVLLVIVLTPLGDSVKGSQRWIPLGILNLQPSELAKPVLVAALAAVLSERRGTLALIDVGRCFAIAAPMALLVFLQPDFGTMLVLGWIFIVMLIVGGANWKQLAVLLVIAAIGAGGLFQLGMMHDYQRARLQAFLDPESPEVRFGEGYSYRLTRWAVANGGFAGQGMFMDRDRPSLTELDYVREQHTDFVFTVIAEQMGFLGGALLLVLYGTVFLRALRAASMARDSFGSMLAAGLAGYLSFQVFVNIGMTIGIVPITGVPLPFVSYGGSSLVASALAVGLLLSVRMRRFARPLG